MIIIDEELAKRNKENYSMFGYRSGSATEEYNQVVAEAKEQIEKAKRKVKEEESKIKLDELLEKFKYKYADWINKHNRSGAGHVSVMISGAGNYDIKKHEKWLKREGKFWKEYKDINEIIGSGICKILNSERIIKTDDLNAIEKLEEKLKKAQEEHQGYKDYNSKARKEGKAPLSAYVLSNSNQRIRSIKQRIEKVKLLALQETKEIEINGVNGTKIIDNVEVNRLQIVFDFKPDADIRTQLKKHGFRWSPTSGAWQRYRSTEAERIAKEIVSNIKLK